MPTPPDVRFVTAHGGAIEPLVHAPESVQSARIRRVGMVDGAGLEDERAHARPLARVRRRVGTAHRREGDVPLAAALPRSLAPVVVLDASLALLLLGEPDAEVGVEVSVERGGPGERPAHSSLVRLHLGERRPRHRPEHHVVVGEVHDESVEAVRDRRAGRATSRVVGPEHEVIDEELRTPSEEIRQRSAPLVGLEAICLVNPHPWQFPPLPRQLVAAPRERFFRLEQLAPRGEPPFTCPGLVRCHLILFPSRCASFRVGDSSGSPGYVGPPRTRVSTLRDQLDRISPGIDPVPLSIWSLDEAIQ